MVALCSGLGRLALVGARELVLKRQHGALDVAVGVAGAAAAAVEAAGGGHAAAGGGARGAGVERGGHAGGGGGQRGADKVAGAAAAGVDVGVLRYRGVRLGDGVAGHGWRVSGFFFFFLRVECVVVVMMVVVVGGEDRKGPVLARRSC